MLTPALADFTSFLLRRAYVLAAGHAADDLPPGRRPRDAVVLASLVMDPCSQKQLAERLHVDRTIVAQLIDRLEREGLVVRHRNPEDRRSYILEPTPAGRQTLERLAPHMARSEAAYTERLSAPERARLNELLREVLASNGGREAPPALADTTGFLVTQAHMRTRERAAEALAPLRIEPRHLSSLLAIAEMSPSQQDLARQLGVSGPVVVELIDELEGKALVERGRNPHDRRSYALVLTAEGRDVISRARAALATAAVETGPAGEELRALLRKLLGLE